MEFDGLPKSVTVTGALVPAEADRALLTLSSKEQESASQIVSLQGHARDADLRRVAEAEDVVAGEHLVPLRGRLALAVAEPGPLGIRWVDDQSGAALVAGGVYSARAEIVRGTGAIGKVRMVLLTSQIMPKKKAPDPKDKKKEIMVDDLERALHLKGQTVFDSTIWGVTAQVHVPSDLPNRDWGHCFESGTSVSRRKDGYRHRDHLC